MDISDYLATQHLNPFLLLGESPTEWVRAHCKGRRYQPPMQSGLGTCLRRHKLDAADTDLEPEATKCQAHRIPSGKRGGRGGLRGRSSCSRLGGPASEITQGQTAKCPSSGGCVPASSFRRDSSLGNFRRFSGLPRELETTQRPWVHHFLLKLRPDWYFSYDDKTCVVKKTKTGTQFVTWR